MTMIKTYLADRYEPETNTMRRSTRRYTKEAIEASKILELVEDSEQEIDCEDLVSGEGWTPENYVLKPKK